MKHAIIYCRFSPRPNVDECKSNEKQEERCRVYCEKAGIIVESVFYDIAISGKRFDRPALHAALADLRSGMALVVDTSDRLARDMLVALTIRHQVQQAGATIEFADGSPLADTPEGELFANILAAFAAYERSRFARRTKAGLAKKKERGEHLGRIPIGWKIDPETKQLVLHSTEQAAIQHAKALRRACFKSEQIASELTRNYGHCRGKPWSARTVRRILSKVSEQ